MSRLDQLISQYCPAGVPMVRLGEVATYTRGVSYNKGQESQTSIGAIPILRANNITLQKNSINFEDVKYIKKDVRVKPEQYLKKNDIFICAGSGSKEHVGKVAFVEKDLNYCFGGFMAVIRTKVEILPRFLYHNFIGSRFNEYLIDSLNSTTINNLNSTIINNYLIPLPPLPVQEEIVCILDAMSDLVTNLDAEISARQKQYEHAREKLLTFGEEVEKKQLGEVCHTVTPPRKLQTSEYQEKGVFPVIDQGKDYITAYTSDTDCLLPDGEYLLYGDHTCIVKYFKGQFAQGADGLKILQSKEGLCKFIYYAVCAHNVTSTEYKRHWAQARELSIPLPPLSVRQSIVERLDKMESLIQNLQAERDLRQKQYEYYREKLLTF